MLLLLQYRLIMVGKTVTGLVSLKFASSRTGPEVARVSDAMVAAACAFSTHATWKARLGKLWVETRTCSTIEMYYQKRLSRTSDVIQVLILQLSREPLDGGWRWRTTLWWNVVEGLPAL